MRFLFVMMILPLALFAKGQNKKMVADALEDSTFAKEVLETPISDNEAVQESLAEEELLKTVSDDYEEDMEVVAEKPAAKTKHLSKNRPRAG